MTSSVETFQIAVATAESYEAKLVPALFGPWATYLVDAADLAPGQAVLDVACGTGVVAREAANRLAGRGRIVGLDLNEGMLTVARRLRPDIEWRQGDAGSLPFEDGSFDRVLCQSALMFFPDHLQALREMARVVTVDGTVAVQVWASRDRQLGYRPFFDVVERHCGPDAVDLISTYWSLGDLDELAALFEAAGLKLVDTRTRVDMMRLGSIDELVTVEVESTPLIERISGEVYGRIREDAREALLPFRTQTGRLELPIEGHLITARKR